MVALADLDDFLTRFRAAGVSVSRAGDGMANVIQASELARWPAIDIVRLVLDGGLRRIELLSAEEKFKSVLVDPDEVRRAAEARAAQGRLSVDEASIRLKMDTWAVRALASSPHRNGPPFLAASLATNAKGASRLYFNPDDLDRYAVTHVDLKSLAKEQCLSAKALRKQLSGRGVEPILPRSKLNKLV